MNRREWLAASSTLLAAACARSSERAISSKDAPDERPDIPSLLQLASVPGMAIATVHGGDVSVEGFGVRRAGTDDKVTGDTVFEAASLSKPVFASIVMQLAAEGLIDLTRPLVSYLPLPLGMKTSGFIWRPDLDAALASPHTNRGQPMDSFNVKSGKALAGLVAEMGKPVEEWTADDVEKVLPRMDATIPVLPNNMVPNAAASLLTTARDYGAFVRWLLGAGPVSGGRAILDRMIVQRSSINQALGWGAGIGLEQAAGRKYIWHWGDNPGFKNFVVGEPAAASAIVIFTNGNAGQRVYERVIRARTGVDHPAFL